MSKPKKFTSLADMSLPAKDRAKGRKPGVVATPPAQMDHASSPRAKRLTRDGQRWLARMTAEREEAGLAFPRVPFPADFLISDESDAGT